MKYQSRLMVLVFCSLFFFSNNKNKNVVESYLGINWGRIATQRILPSMVVDMILQNGIPEVKVFSASKNVLNSFVGTDIGVSVSVPNDELKNINNVEDAINWINLKLTPYVQLGITLRYITIGSQPFTQRNKTYPEAVAVLDFMQTAINELGLAIGKNVKVTIDHSVGVLKKGIIVPSQAEFSVEVSDVMRRSTEILAKYNAPICLDMFPLYSAKTLYNDTEIAFFDNNSKWHFMDGEYKYTNIFDVLYDMFVCSLEKLGFPDVKVVIGAVGWPTDGIYDGNIKNAERFNRGLIKYIMSGKGTPRKPGPIDAYLHNLSDENKLKFNASSADNAGFIRHWGIYRFDGKPKYHLDFSGEDRNVYPVSARGITHMPNRWCVFNQKSNDTSLLEGFLLDACKSADCTPIGDGGTCSNLTFYQKVSYAFNVFFQEKSQKFSDMGCDFEGYGMITPDDPSFGTCVFPVEILSSETLAGSHSDRHAPVVTIILVPMFLGFMFWM